MLVFHRVACRKGDKELPLEELGVFIPENLSLGPIAAQLLRLSRFKTLSKRNGYATEEMKLLNKFWVEVSGLTTNLR